MKNLIKSLLPIIFLFLSTTSFSQESPVWDIGTKWTYQYEDYSGPYTLTSYVTTTITDTLTLDGLLLYKIEGEPVETGPAYFHYINGDVYSYDPFTKVLQLLYDFDNESMYSTDYVPICDPSFDSNVDQFWTYDIKIDSITDYSMPDGSQRKLQHTTKHSDEHATSVTPRVILDGIGFVKGEITSTHDWVIGMLICDIFFKRVTNLRCFENDTINYNFVDHPCDSTWIVSSTNEIDIDISLFPNPTSNSFEVKGIDAETPYEIYQSDGGFVSKGFITQNGAIELQTAGLHIVRFYVHDQWCYKRVLRIE